MRTLLQIEPRIDLQATPVPAGVSTADGNYEFVISASGSYYLSKNLVVVKPNGIKVAAAGVTLDLKGFEISRSPGTSGGLAIDVPSIRSTIKDGTINGFGVGISSGLVGNSSSSIVHVSVSGCSGYGIGVGNGWVIESCGATSNRTGISGGLGCTIRNCTVTLNGLGSASDAGIFSSSYSTIENSSVISQQSGSGIYAQSGSTIDHCAVGNSTVTQGIGAEAGSTIAYCAVNDLTSVAGVAGGILLSGTGNVTACTVRNVQNNNGTPTGTTGFGISGTIGAIVKACTAQGNKGDGIHGGNNCLLTDNLSTDNGSGANCGGIHVTGSGNRIESNNLVGNNANGVLCDAGGNLIIKNSSRGGSTAFNLATGNSEGAEINVFDPNATTTISSSNSWANFLY